MKIIIFYCAIFFWFLSSNNSLAQTTISVADFKPLIGSWSGTLMYLDYSTGKPFTMPAGLKIIQIEETNNFIFYNSFPDEPHANSSDTVSISDDGTMLNAETVKNKRLLEDGSFEIVTESMGVDGNDDQPATIRHTYIIGRDLFIIRKDVQFAGEHEWIIRNEFNFKWDSKTK